MKKSELRQLIREEIRSTLSEKVDVDKLGKDWLLKGFKHQWNDHMGGGYGQDDGGYISKGQELLKAAGHSPAEIKKITANVKKVFDAWEKKQRASWT